jgi:hypothetical protein
VDEVEEDNIPVLVDVDYHVDMPDLLLRTDTPVCVFGYEPTSVSDTGYCSSSFYFDGDEFVTEVTGGATYSHKLWDWSADSVGVFDWRDWSFEYKAYKVDKVGIARHHRAMLLSPIAHYRGFSALLAYFTIKTPFLRRLSVDTGTGFTRLDSLDEKGEAIVSIGRSGQRGCCELPARVFGEMLVTAENTYRKEGTKPLTPYMANGAVRAELGRDVQIKNRTYATEFINRLMGYDPKAVAKPVEAPLVNYGVAKVQQYVEFERVDQDPGKPSLHPFMEPIVKYGAYTPNKTAGNSTWSVQDRVTKYQKREEPDLSMIDRLNVKEFITCLQEDIGEPLGKEDIEEVVNRQHRPAQRVKVERAENSFCEPEGRASTFNKAEAYQKIKAPRIITEPESLQRIDYATFTYVLGDALKRTSWYLSGATPRQVAEVVAAICVEVKRFIELGDFERMDGTKTRKLRREFDEPLLMGLFAREFHSAILEAFRKSIDLRTVDRFGQTAETGPTQASGDMATAVMNAIHNKFIAFCGYRRMGLPPREAYDAAGGYVGDDGLSADLDPVAHREAAARWGFILTADVVERGNAGVNFLSRYYSPHVWWGCPDSMCDVRRQLAKFHLSTTKHEGVKACQFLAEKATAYWLTDANTPYIGDVCTKVLELADVRQDEVGIGEALSRRTGSWWARWDKADQFPNDDSGGWMQAEVEKLMPGVTERGVFIARLDAIKSLSDLVLSPTLTIWEAPIAPGARDAAVVNAQTHGTAVIRKVQDKEPTPKGGDAASAEAAGRKKSVVVRNKRTKGAKGKEKVTSTSKPRRQPVRPQRKRTATLQRKKKS